MPLTAESKTANILKSLNAHFHTNLVTADSLQVHFPGRRELFTPSGATWVQLTYLLGTARQRYARVDENSRGGGIVTGIINLNCCELVAQRTNRYALASLRDTVYNRIAPPKTITIQDYDTGGNPTTGYFVILDLDENDVQDGHGPDDNGIAILNLSASGHYIEAYT